MYAMAALPPLQGACTALELIGEVLKLSSDEVVKLGSHYEEWACDKGPLHQLSIHHACQVTSMIHPPRQQPFSHVITKRFSLNSKYQTHIRVKDNSARGSPVNERTKHAAQEIAPT